MKLLLFSVLFFLSTSLFAQTIPAYKNAQLPVESRVQDLLQRMTIGVSIGPAMTFYHQPF